MMGDLPLGLRSVAHCRYKEKLQKHLAEGRGLDPCFRRAVIRLIEMTPGRHDYKSFMLVKTSLYFKDFVLKHERGRILQ